MKTAIELSDELSRPVRVNGLCLEAAAMLRQQAEQLSVWLAANGPGGWIDDLRNKCEALEITNDALKADAERYRWRREAQQEQPAQEPVGRFVKATYGDYGVLDWHPSYVAKIGDCLYTHPAPTQPALSDDEIWQFWCNRPEVPEGEDDSMEAEFVAACKRAIEAHCRGGQA